MSDAAAATATWRRPPATRRRPPARAPNAIGQRVHASVRERETDEEMRREASERVQ